VLRYGVRSPRVVAPTATPGLALLPVGSRTVDFPGTFGADAVPPLFAELRRGGEFLVVNGPDLADLEGAIPFLDQVPGWILVLALGRSEAERMRSLRDRLGKDRCVGIVAIGEVSAEAASAEAGAPPAALSDTGPASEEELPWEETPVAAAAPESREVAAPLEEAVMEPQEEVADVYEAVPPHPAGPAPIRLRRPRGFLIGIVVVLLVAIAGSLWLGPKQTSRSTRSSEERAATAPVTTTPGATATESAPSLETSPTSAGTEAPAQGSEPPAAGEASKTTTTPGGEPATSSAPATETPSPVSPPATTDQATSPPAEAARVPVATSPQTHDARPAEPPPAAPRAAGQTGATPAPLGAIVGGVHVSSVKGRDGALQEAQRLAAGGRSTFVKQTEVPGKGTWWRVYVGPFGARAEAERMAATLRAAGEDAQVYRLARADVEAGMGREDR
jgi:cell division protein FtsN